MVAQRIAEEPCKSPSYVSEGDAPAKQRILAAALHLFVRDGFCETSIRDIARESGFSNPALFKHFESKEAVAIFLFECCYLQLYHLIAQATASNECFAVRQRAAINAFLDALDREMDSVLYVQETLRHFWSKMPERVRKHSILAEVRKMLEAGRKEGIVTGAIDIRLLTNAWLGTLQQFARMRYYGEFQEPSSTMATALEELLTKMAAT
jgi:AcrR family transcriptional regulator